MIPFALPVVLAPRITHRLATRFSGRSLLAAGLAITVVGNAAFWLVGGSHLPYEDRAGMASGLASTTRVHWHPSQCCGAGCHPFGVARDRFVAGASKAGLAADAARQAAARVTSGDLAGLLAAVPAAARDALHSI